MNKKIKKVTWEQVQEKVRTAGDIEIIGGGLGLRFLYLPFRRDLHTDDFIFTYPINSN